MTEPDPDHFEMRRMESLSNTVFGVAMTLLAYNLPKDRPNSRGCRAGPISTNFTPRGFQGWS